MMTKEEKRANRTIRRRAMLYGKDHQRVSSVYRSNLKKEKYDLSPMRKARFYASKEWKTIREWLFKRCRYQCVCCRVGKNLQVDHIFPISKSPELALDFKNVQFLCEECNQIKLNHTNKKFTAYTRLGASKSFMPNKEEIEDLKKKWVNFFPEHCDAINAPMEGDVELLNFFA